MPKYKVYWRATIAVETEFEIPPEKLTNDDSYFREDIISDYAHDTAWMAVREIPNIKEWREWEVDEWEEVTE